MSQKIRKIVLLPVFILAVVFLLGNFKSEVFAEEKKEKGGKIDSFFVLSKENKLELKAGIEGFAEEKKVEWKLYLSEKKEKFPKEEVRKETTKGKKEIKFSVTTDVESSGYYYVKLTAKQGKKKVEKRLELPVYVRGKESFGKEIRPEAKFVNDVLVIDWEGEENQNYWVGVYDSKTLELIQEEKTKIPTLSLNLPKETNKISVGVTLLKKGEIKNPFSLVEVGNREEPNVMVKFLEQEFLKKREAPFNLIFTGNCDIRFFLNEKEEVGKIKESGEYKVELSEGENRLLVSVRSENGNEKTFEKMFLVDTVKPKISLDTALDGAVTGDAFIHIAGEIDEEVRLKLNDNPLTQDEEGRFQTNFPLKEGENEIKLVAEDRAGNTGTVRAIVKMETEHEADKRIVFLVFGTFGVIFLAYFVTFMKWIFARKKRKS